MADDRIAYPGSPEEVAFKLFTTIASVERMSISGAKPEDLRWGWSKADREWILRTYVECLTTVRTGRYVEKSLPQRETTPDKAA